MNVKPQSGPLNCPETHWTLVSGSSAW